VLPTEDDYRPSKFHLSNSEVRSTGIMCGGAVRNIALELLLLRCRHARLVEALRSILPYMEKAEDALFVGHEGCHWPVENIRALLAEIEAAQ
jgi:hypothetical protein